jgi:hypothetical protein
MRHPMPPRLQGLTEHGRCPRCRSSSPRATARQRRRLLEALAAALRDDHELSSWTTARMDRTCVSPMPRGACASRASSRGGTRAGGWSWRIRAEPGEFIGVLDADLQHPPEIRDDAASPAQRPAPTWSSPHAISGAGVGSGHLARVHLRAPFRLSQALLRGEAHDRSALRVLPGARGGRRGSLSPVGFKILLEILVGPLRGGINPTSLAGRTPAGRRRASAKVCTSFGTSRCWPHQRKTLVEVPLVAPAAWSSTWCVLALRASARVHVLTRRGGRSHLHVHQLPAEQRFVGRSPRRRAGVRAAFGQVLRGDERRVPGVPGLLWTTWVLKCWPTSSRWDRQVV